MPIVADFTDNYNDITTQDKETILDDVKQSFSEAVLELSKYNNKRNPVTIMNKADLDYILSINHSRARTKSILMDLLADYGDGPKFEPYSIITVPVNSYGGLSKSKIESDRIDAIAIIESLNKDIPTSTKVNSVPIVTTLGLYLFNRIFIEPLSDLLGYINESITSDVYSDLINGPLSYALLEDRISIKQLKNIINDSQIIMSCCSAWSSSHTEKIFLMQPYITKRKNEILERPEIKEKLKVNDFTTMKQVEKELIDYATKELLKDDPSLDMYYSKARANLGNNFRNMYISRSGVLKTDGSTEFVSNALMEGLDMKSYSTITDGAVIGSYSRSCMTAKPGYMERLFLGATSHIKILGEDSDCGTKKYINVALTSKNIKQWYYSFIINKDGKLEELLPANKDKYIGTTVKMRYASLCEAPSGFICEHCFGSLTRRIGITNIGLLTPVAMSSLKNASMKAAHDTSLVLTHVDPNYIFGF